MFSVILGWSKNILGGAFLGHTLFQHLIQIGAFSSFSHPNDHLDSQFSLLDTFLP